MSYFLARVEAKVKKHYFQLNLFGFFEAINNGGGTCSERSKATKQDELCEALSISMLSRK